MCMFGGSGPAFSMLSVSSTNIFARADGDHQFLVYSMNVASIEPVAMILPLPLPANPSEDAVEFLNLERYPEFFRDVVACFPSIEAEATRGPIGGGVFPQAARQPLKVHQAGDFEASFVPTRGDFDRLDRRFRIDDSVWDALPSYGDWSFAVFQLRDIADQQPKLSFWGRVFGRTHAKPIPKTIHPMAFRFPRRHTDRLFFPTVHVHDGEVHESSQFDHSLFWQDPDADPSPGLSYSDPARVRMDLERALGMVDGQLGFHRRQLSGTLPNQDHWALGNRLLHTAQAPQPSG